MLRLAAVVLALGLVLGGLGTARSSEPTRNVNKFRERIETLTMWKMMEALDLDKETSDKILALRRKFETKRNELEKSIGEDFRKLRSLVTTEGNAGDKELAALIDSIRGKKKQLDGLRDAHFTEMSKVLSVRQQAKLILFLKDFRREIREMIRSSMRQRPPEGEFRHRGGGPGGRFGPPPGGEPPGPPPLPGGRWDAGPSPDDDPEGR